jgi:pyroglutamyl-peptidase
MSETFLVTGFEPFKEHRTNSSWDALELLRERWPAGITALRLPVDHHRAHEALREALADLRPRAVLCTGLAKGRVFRIERRARRPEALAAEEGEALAEGRWPWDEMRRELESCGVPILDSMDAGRYVCESTYWSLLTYSLTESGAPRGHRSAAREGTPEFAAFLHVPPAADEQPLTLIAEAVGRVIQARYSAIASPAVTTNGEIPLRGVPTGAERHATKRE